MKYRCINNIFFPVFRKIAYTSVDDYWNQGETIRSIECKPGDEYDYIVDEDCIVCIKHPQHPDPIKVRKSFIDEYFVLSHAEFDDALDRLLEDK